MPTLITPEIQHFQSDLKKFGVPIVTENHSLDAKNISNILILNPMPNSAQPSINRNILGLLGNNEHNIIRPTIWNIPVEADGTTASIDISDKKLEKIQQTEFDGVISLGASIDHVAYDQIENLDKLRNIFRWATEKTGGLLTICWSSMLAYNEFHNIPLHVNTNNKGERVKIIGHFQNAAEDVEHPFIPALKQIPVLPLGCTGFLNDANLEQLEKEGKITILARSPNKAQAKAGSTIGFTIDNKHSLTCIGPHPDYNPRIGNIPASVEVEIARDLDPETAQPGVIIEKIIGTDKFNQDWRPGTAILFTEWVKEVNANKALLNNPATYG